YAHNTDGFKQLSEFMKTVQSDVKLGIIACPGDRRDEDLRNMGKYAAQMFDEIIIRHDKDGRGRTDEDITRLIKEGIHTVRADMPLQIISDEFDAIRHVMENAERRAFIVVCTEDVHGCIDFVSKKQEEELRTSGRHLHAF
ncbi:MAG TPA: cyanophycin synthetase, partial [Chitinophagaceae bacterium]|nr:cyanophycin synthetase [Chitinophagaceae bacterium]